MQFKPLYRHTSHAVYPCLDADNCHRPHLLVSQVSQVGLFFNTL